jgi:hypothetical protein
MDVRTEDLKIKNLIISEYPKKKKKKKLRGTWPGSWVYFESP